MSDILQQARELERQGALLDAYDLLRAGIERDPADVGLKHRAVLSLARVGAALQARRDYRAYGLDQVEDHEDVIALGGRLLKDEALALSGEERANAARAAIMRYRKAFRLRRATYPAINIATLRVMLGQRKQAQCLAQWILGQVLKQPSTPYFDRATEAEALLILGDQEAADRALAAAIACDPDNLVARASSLRQLQMLSGLLGTDSQWLERHRPPPSLHYCGHAIARNADQSDIATLRNKIFDAFRADPPGALFGALAAGSDLLIAEAALAQRAALHIVLPFAEADFIRCSVAPWGEQWVTLYEHCKSRATRFWVALPEPYLGDDQVFNLGSAYAMGFAIRQARSLQTRVSQLCLWDGKAALGVAGTARDVEAWRGTGLPQTILPFPDHLRETAPNVTPSSKLARPRSERAILFGDVAGFSRLQESQVPVFIERVMGALAQELERRGIIPDQVATWGDGLHLVFADVTTAANAALQMQECFRLLDFKGLGLPDHLALRIGGHFGPLTAMDDPFTGVPSHFGSHNTIAARIEPVALPGSIFVSEPFSAMLALSGHQQFHSDYVGITELPKRMGAMRLFAVHRA